MNKQPSIKCICGLWFATKEDLEKHYKDKHVQVTYNKKTGRFYIIRKRIATTPLPGELKHG